MSEFRYPLPEEPRGSQWEQLSDDAKHVLGQSALGESTGDALTSNEPNKISEYLTAEVREWASQELSSLYWGMLGANTDLMIPLNLEELAEQTKYLGDELMHLYDVKQQFLAGNETTPSGTNIGETLHLTLMPWKLMRDNVDNFNAWIWECRKLHELDRDVIHADVLDVISNDLPLYFTQDAGAMNPEEFSSAKEYLDWRIMVDGNWGVMLTQNSTDYGLTEVIGDGPNEITGNGGYMPHIYDINVGQMGIFEWLALTMQVPYNNLLSTSHWLIANRFDADDVSASAYVPKGEFSGGAYKLSRTAAHVKGVQEVRNFRLAIG